MILIYICLIILIVASAVIYKIVDTKNKKELQLFISRALSVKKGMTYEEVSNIFRNKGECYYVKVDHTDDTEEYYWKSSKLSRRLGYNNTFIGTFKDNVLINYNLSSNYTR